MASAVRQYVGSQGILYRGTKELFNISAYEYEVEDVFKRTGDRENGLLLKTGERRLLNTARQILLSEVMLVRSQKLEEADQWLHKFFN